MTEAKKLVDDLLIIGMSIAFAVFLIKTNTLQSILTSTKEIGMIGTFIAGMLFTSLFTTAPAVVVLGEIAQVNSIWTTAFIGAFGALIIDTTIFLFFRNHLSDHVKGFIKKKAKTEKAKHLFNVHFKWVPFIIGGIIIASPLPDELALGIMGFSKMNIKWFMVCSYIFNFLGIVVIGLIARALM